MLTRTKMLVSLKPSVIILGTKGWMLTRTKMLVSLKPSVIILGTKGWMLTRTKMLVSFETVSHQIGDQRLDAYENQDACFVETVSHQIGDQRLDAYENQDACFIRNRQSSYWGPKAGCLREPRCLFHSKPSVIRLGTKGWMLTRTKMLVSFETVSHQIGDQRLDAYENQDACFIRNRQSSYWGPKAGCLREPRCLFHSKPSVIILGTKGWMLTRTKMLVSLKPSVIRLGTKGWMLTRTKMLVSFETVSHQIGDQRLDAYENQDACFVETVSHQIGDQRLDAYENQDACFIRNRQSSYWGPKAGCLREPRCLFHSKPSVIRLGTKGWMLTRTKMLVSFETVSHQIGDQRLDAYENQDACFIRNRQSSYWGPKAGCLREPRCLFHSKPSVIRLGTKGWMLTRTKMLVSFETVSHHIGDQRLDAYENQDACFVETVSHQIGDQRLDAYENQDACFIRNRQSSNWGPKAGCLREPRCLFR
ncbi:hypothetical protein BX666DRAFT_387479 [Dichotomocladium elegans]|nr:hypothetical protein BX666DRAFT_387479 [Dichotomocladium elegans]